MTSKDWWVKPCGYRITVRLKKAEEKTRGGVFLVDQTKDEKRHLAMIAEVVELGPEAYVSTKDRTFSQPWCRVGDFIQFSKYAGSRMVINEIEYRSINDDEVQGVVPEGRDPAEIRAAS